MEDSGFPDGERLLTMSDVAERLAFDRDGHKHPTLAARRWCQGHDIGGAVGRSYRVAASVFDAKLREAVGVRADDLREAFV